MTTIASLGQHILNFQTENMEKQNYTWNVVRAKAWEFFIESLQTERVEESDMIIH